MGGTGLETNAVSALFYETYGISTEGLRLEKRLVDAKTFIEDMFDALPIESQQMLLSELVGVVD